VPLTLTLVWHTRSSGCARPIIWSEISERDGDLWTEEVFEVFVDVDRDRRNYLELQINPLGIVLDVRFRQKFGTGEGSRRDQLDRALKYTVDGTLNDDSDSDTAWSVELRIPYASIPGVDSTPAAGAEWSVNFYRYDRPSEKRTLSFGWNTLPLLDFHQTSNFGRFTFGSYSSDDQ
jgi:hypothetical protein